MELKYEKALQEYKLNINDLPEDAKIGIENINGVLKGINMLQKNGRKVTEKTIKKLNAMDKWVYYEILDVVNDTDKNKGEIPYEEEEVLDEALEESDDDDNGDNYGENNGDDDDDEQGEEGNSGEDEKEYTQQELEGFGVTIDEQLSGVYATGKKQLTLQEIKMYCKKAYDLIFENYENDGDNGIETSNFTLIELEENLYELNKK